MSKEGEPPTVQQQIDALKDTSEYAAALNAHGKTVLEANRSEIFGKAQGEAFGHFDALAKGVLGIEIDRGTKTTDVYKPLLEELKTFRANKGANSEDVDKALATQNTAHELQVSTMTTAMEELEAKNLELLSNGTKRDIAAVITKELQGKAFKAHYTESDLKTLVGSKTNQIVSNGKMESEKVVFYNPDGTKILDTKGLPITAKELVEREFSEMFQVKTAGGSADEKDNKEGGLEGEGETKKLKLNMGDIKTREQFFIAANKILTAQGLASYEDEYNILYKGAMQEYSYNDLPVK